MYDKEQLAQYGKRASDMFVKHAMPLNQAVGEVTKGLNGFTDEHLKRVVENANLITFEELFKNGPSKHVVFDLASFDDVKSLSHNHEDEFEPRDEAYSSRPYSYQTDAFDDKSTEKTSSYTEIPAHVESRRTLHHIESAQNHLSSWLQKVDSDLEYETVKLESMCKKASYAEGGYTPVLQLLYAVSNDDNSFEKIASTLTINPSNWRHEQGEMSDLVPNVDHPIAKQYLKVEGLVKEAKRLRGANIYLEDQRRKVLHTVGSIL